MAWEVDIGNDLPPLVFDGGRMEQVAKKVIDEYSTDWCLVREKGTLVWHSFAKRTDGTIKKVNT